MTASTGEKSFTEGEACHRFVFVHVRVFGRGGVPIPEDKTVCVEGDRIADIRAEGNVVISGMSRIVMGMRRFLIRTPFPLEEVCSENGFDLDKLTARLIRSFRESGVSHAGQSEKRVSEASKDIAISKGEKARLLLLNNDPLVATVTDRDIAGLYFQGSYYSEMQLRGRWAG